MKIASKVALTGAIAAGFLFEQAAFADASYQETTQITGGSLMSMMKMASVFSSKARGLDKPVVSTVLLHGNKLAHVRPTTTEIIDLDGQTITNIDNERKQYSVMTFEQMKQAMKEAAERAKEKKGASDSDAQNVQVSFHAKVTNSGVTKEIDGQQAKEALLTLTMDPQTTDSSKQTGSLAVASEMWLVPDAAGYTEIRDFNMRLAKVMAANVDTSALAGVLRTQPGASDALAGLQKEAEKMQGIPVLQTTRMGMTTNGAPLPPPSETKTDSSGEASKQAENSAADRLGSLGKMMGNSSLGGLMRHKKSQSADQDSASSQSTSHSAANDGTPQAATLLEMKTERSNFSSGAVDTSKFEIPSGYKQVQSQMEKAAQSSH